MSQLSPKQKRFAEEYLKDLNGSAAYRRAGYAAKSESVARANAARLIANANVQAYLHELQSARSHRTAITADRVLQEIARIAFADVTQVVTFDDGGINLKSSSELTPEITAAIAEVTETTTRQGTTVSVKMHNKISALNLAAQHTGLLGEFNKAIATLKLYGVNLQQTDGRWQVVNADPESDSTPENDLLSEVESGEAAPNDEED